MHDGSQQERQARAARNQALFRSVNEKLKEVNRAFAEQLNTLTIACECADTTCVEMLEISPLDYERVRADPLHFVVLPDHVYPEVEVVIGEEAGYVIVEKQGAAASQLLDSADKS